MDYTERDWDREIDEICKEDKINERNRLFLEYYHGISSRVASDAYRRAYPDTNSIATTYANSSKLLRKANLQRLNALLRERHLAEVNFNKADMLADMLSMHRVTLDDFIEVIMVRHAVIDPETGKQEMTEDGDLVWELRKEIYLKQDWKELPKSVKMALCEIKQTRDGLQFKLVEKNKLAELIGKYTDSFTPETNVNVQAQVVFHEDITEADLE